jgi:lipoate-protein ligase A
LTYSIVCSPGHIPPAASVKDSFRILTGFLIDFYRSLGLDACYAVDSASEPDRLGVRTAFCFAGKETFDIVIDGKKIGGNAQRRHKNVIFQHGSIPVLNRAHQGLQYMKDRSLEYADNAASLSDFGISEDLIVLKRMLIEAFRRCMNVETCESRLSPDEQGLSLELSLQKYATDRWNLQGEAE